MSLKALVATATVVLQLGGIWEGGVEWAKSLFNGILNAIVNDIATPIIEYVVDVVVYTPRPKRCTIPDGYTRSEIDFAGGKCLEAATGNEIPDSTVTPALFQKPMNGAWPQVYELFWVDFLPGMLVVVVFTYIVSTLLDMTPLGLSSITPDPKGGGFGVVLVLPLWWYGFTIYLTVAAGLLQVIRPADMDGFVALVTATFGALTAVGLTGLAAPFSILLGALDVLMIIILFILYLSRIIIILGVPAFGPVVAGLYMSDIPGASDIGEKALNIWAKIIWAPLPLLAALRIVDKLISVPDDDWTSLTIELDILSLPGGAGDAIIVAALGLLLPMFGVAGMYAFKKANIGRTASQGITTLQRRNRYRDTKLGKERAEKVTKPAAEAGRRSLRTAKDGTEVAASYTATGASAAADGVVTGTKTAGSYTASGVRKGKSRVNEELEDRFGSEGPNTDKWSPEVQSAMETLHTAGPASEEGRQAIETMQEAGVGMDTISDIGDASGLLEGEMGYGEFRESYDQDGAELTAYADEQHSPEVQQAMETLKDEGTQSDAGQQAINTLRSAGVDSSTVSQLANAEKRHQVRTEMAKEKSREAANNEKADPTDRPENATRKYQRNGMTNLGMKTSLGETASWSTGEFEVASQYESGLNRDISAVDSWAVDSDAAESPDPNSIEAYANSRNVDPSRMSFSQKGVPIYTSRGSSGFGPGGQGQEDVGETTEGFTADVEDTMEL